MTHTFAQERSGVVVVVDDDGIREEREGRIRVSIPWEELDFPGRTELRGRGGKVIRWPMWQKEQRAAANKLVRRIWRQRYPEKWRRFWADGIRATDRVFHYFFPGMFLIVLALWGALGLALGWPAKLMQGFGVRAVFLIVLSTGMLIWYRWWLRPEMLRDEGGTAESESPAVSPGTEEPTMNEKR